MTACSLSTRWLITLVLVGIACAAAVFIIAVFFRKFDNSRFGAHLTDRLLDLVVACGFGAIAALVGITWNCWR